jgi:hypothetical protein
MGIFEYKPDDNKNTVKIHDGDNSYQFNLPSCLPNGYALKVNSIIKGNMILQIEKSAGLPAIPLGVSIMCRGEIVYFRKIYPDSGAGVLKIPREDLPEGVNQITLFDAKGEVFAERPVFISRTQNSGHRIEAIPDKEEYAPRERISIDFSIGIPETHFSLSVRDAGNKIAVPDKGDIRTHLLLASELKGYVNNPSYYFESDEAERRNALDLLMLVQGWKRYEWQVMAGIKPFSQDYDSETGLKIKGKIAGNFSTAIDRDLYGRHSLLLSSPGLKNARLNIRLDKWFSPAPEAYSFYETMPGNIKNTEEKTAEPENKADRAFVKESPVKVDSLYTMYEIEEIPVHVNRKRGKDLIYDVEKDREKAIDRGKYYPRIAHDYLVENCPGFRYKSLDPDKPWDNDLSVCGQWCMGNGWGVLWRIDNGKYSLNESSPMANNWDEIQKIVIKFGERYQARNESLGVGSYIPEYMVAVPFYFYLYKNVENTHYYYRRKPDYRVTVFEGYSEVKDFYSGRPEREDYLPARFEHSRTLYWNPNVKTDANGRVQIRFYNSAFCEKIDISAEGITKKGILITKQKL